MDIFFNPDLIKFIRLQNFFYILVLIYAISTLIYWLSSKFLGKRRNDTFDGWFVITLVTMGWGRLAYVLSTWNKFMDSYWFYLPYERYADKVYLFRAMPWKLITVWDGGFLYTAMLAAFLLGAILFIIIYKKWSVREMFAPVALSMNAMMSLIFYAFGIYLGGNFTGDLAVYKSIGIIGIINFVGVFIMLIVNYIINVSNVQTHSRKLFRDLLNFIYLIVSSYFFVNVFLNSGLQITGIDRVNIYVYIALLVVFVFSGLLSVNQQNALKDQQVHVNAPARNRAIKSDLFR